MKPPTPPPYTRKSTFRSVFAKVPIHLRAGAAIEGAGNPLRAGKEGGILKVAEAGWCREVMMNYLQPHVQELAHHEYGHFITKAVLDVSSRSSSEQVKGANPLP